MFFRFLQKKTIKKPPWILFRDQDGFDPAKLAYYPLLTLQLPKAPITCERTMAPINGRSSDLEITADFRLPRNSPSGLNENQLPHYGSRTVQDSHLIPYSRNFRFDHLLVHINSI
jgi:hypothetical protein